MGGLVLEALTAAVAHPQHVSLAGNALFCRGRRLYPVLTCVSESSNGSRDLNLTCFENGPNGLSVFEKTVDRLRENPCHDAQVHGKSCEGVVLSGFEILTKGSFRIRERVIH